MVTPSVMRLLPEPGRHWQARIVLRRQRPVGWDAKCLEQRDDLARMLRGMPGAALEQMMQRLRTIVGFHPRCATLVGNCRPPRSQVRGDAGTVIGDVTSSSDLDRRGCVVQRREILRAV